MSADFGNHLEALRDRVGEAYRQSEQNYHEALENYRQAEENYRQAEENQRLDMSAIEHLHRRFFNAAGSTPTSSVSASSSNGSYSEPSNSSPYGESAGNGSHSDLSSYGSYSETPSNGSYAEPTASIPSTPPPPPTPSKSNDLAGSIREMFIQSRWSIGHWPQATKQKTRRRVNGQAMLQSKEP
jgi:hypothetical protein